MVRYVPLLPLLPLLAAAVLLSSTPTFAGAPLHSTPTAETRVVTAQAVADLCAQPARIPRVTHQDPSQGLWVRKPDYVVCTCSFCASNPLEECHVMTTGNAVSCGTWSVGNCN